MSRKPKSQVAQKNAKASSKQKEADDVDPLDFQEDAIVRHKDDDKKFYCQLCYMQNSPYHTGLWHNRKDHINSRAHKSAEEKLHQADSKGICAPQDTNLNENNANKTSSHLVTALTPETKAELDLSYAKFIFQYRLPFDIVKPLNTFTKQISNTYAYDVIQEYGISRKTVTKASRVVSDTLKGELHKALTSSPFSLSIDTSSDIHGNTYLAICARFLEHENFDRPVTKLYSILPITVSSTGETLYKMITEDILADEETKSNFVGVVTDDGGNMTGSNIGVSARLKDTFKHIVEMKDISHGLHNVFKKAIEAIDRDIIGIVSGISSHFHYSTQASSLLRQILIKMDIPPLEILHQSMTRFLSMRDCIQRLIDLWSGLEKYFSQHGNKTQKDYFSPENELYIRVLSLLVNNIIDMNEYFQAENLIYNEVWEKIKHGYVTIANIIIKKGERSMEFERTYNIPFEKFSKNDIIAGKFDTEIAEILVTSEEFEEQYLLKYDSLRNLLNQVGGDEKNKIISASINFLVMCLKQLKKRLPYANKIMDLSQVVFFEEDYNESKWLALKDLFPNILKTKKQRDDFATEVRKMEYSHGKIRETLRNSITKISPLTLWKRESLNYPNMYLVAQAVFVLPYSSISVERVFSTMKDIKNRKRNRLTIQNLEACLLDYQATRSESFSITVKMIENYLNPKVSPKINPPEDPPAISTQALDTTDLSQKIVPELKKNDIAPEHDSDNEEDEVDDLNEEIMIVKLIHKEDNPLKRYASSTVQEGKAFSIQSKL